MLVGWAVGAEIDVRWLWRVYSGQGKSEGNPLEEGHGGLRSCNQHKPALFLRTCIAMNGNCEIRFSRVLVTTLERGGW